MSGKTIPEKWRIKFQTKAEGVHPRRFTLQKNDKENPLSWSERALNSNTKHMKVAYSKLNIQTMQNIVTLSLTSVILTTFNSCKELKRQIYRKIAIKMLMDVNIKRSNLWDQYMKCVSRRKGV